MYRNARAAFEQIDVNLIYAARTLGMPEIKIFWKVVVPAAGPGIASGTVLTFARALGEYGATSMLLSFFLLTALPSAHMERQWNEGNRTF